MSTEDPITDFSPKPHADGDPVTPPRAARRPSVRKHHGDEFIDNYEWLRDADNPETIAYIEAENDWTRARTAHLQPLREQIFQEIKGRTLETDMSVPGRRGDWWYFARTEEGKQYSTQSRVPVTGDSWTPPAVEPGRMLPGEEVIFDANAEADGHDFFSVGSFSLDDSATRLAYATDVVGDERYTLRIRDLTSGQDLADTIANTSSGALITPDGAYVFYTTVDDAWRPDRVWRHRVGTDPTEDALVWHEPDERFWVGISLSRTNRYVLVEASSKITSETALISVDEPTGQPVIVWPRRDGVEYSVEHATSGAQEWLLICHNIDHEDFAITRTPVPAGVPLAMGEGELVLAPEPGQRIEAVDAFATFLAVSYRDRAVPAVALLGVDEALGASAEIPWRLSPLEFGDELTAVGIAGGEFDQPLVRVGVSSFVRPATVLDYDVAARTAHVRKVQPVLGGYDPDEYAQARLWATADDGTKVPISIVWRRDAVAVDDAGVPQSAAPLRLYGYGAYEASIDPGLSIPRLSALDRGVVFAIAHVRGGGELGRHWYEEGRLRSKRNTFTDFIACARHLIEQGWTTPDRLVAEGGSAGGLLIGAVVNLAPELFAGAVADVPFVDALTSILDPSLPLTVVEWDEWGDPLHDPEVYQYMKSYSPYENVRDGVKYPRILAVTSLHDTRVLYVEPAKWTARLREVGADVLLKTEMSAGHGGVSGRYAQWREVAFELAWTLDVLGSAELRG
ncbi:S9 family peptidase [Rarobacter faecitabidus]|uniref:S9 family peptidase n=1 Tax=Rarobacter faecitabidus TaxID=13243 RepID=UPI003CCC6636